MKTQMPVLAECSARIVWCAIQRLCQTQESVAGGLSLAWFPSKYALERAQMRCQLGDTVRESYLASNHFTQRQSSTPFQRSHQLSAVGAQPHGAGGRAGWGTSLRGCILVVS